MSHTPLAYESLELLSFEMGNLADGFLCALMHFLLTGTSLRTLTKKVR